MPPLIYSLLAALILGGGVALVLALRRRRRTVGLEMAAEHRGWRFAAQRTAWPPDEAVGGLAVTRGARIVAGWFDGVEFGAFWGNGQVPPPGEARMWSAPVGSESAYAAPAEGARERDDASLRPDVGADSSVDDLLSDSKYRPPATSESEPDGPDQASAPGARADLLPDARVETEPDAGVGPQPREFGVCELSGERPSAITATSWPRPTGARRQIVSIRRAPDVPWLRVTPMLPGAKPAAPAADAAHGVARGCAIVAPLGAPVEELVPDAAAGLIVARAGESVVVESAGEWLWVASPHPASAQDLVALLRWLMGVAKELGATPARMPDEPAK